MIVTQAVLAVITLERFYRFEHPSTLHLWIGQINSPSGTADSLRHFKHQLLLQLLNSQINKSCPLMKSSFLDGFLVFCSFLLFLMDRLHPKQKSSDSLIVVLTLASFS